MLRVAGVKRKDKPVEEAPPVPRGLDEQPVHRRGQPEHREPIAERGGGGSAPVDPDKPAARMRRLNAGAKRDRGEPLAREDLGKDCKTAARAVTHHLGERRAPEPAPGGEKRNCFEDVGFAGAIVAVKRDKTRPRAEVSARMIAKIRERKASERHPDSG